MIKNLFFTFASLFTFLTSSSLFTELAPPTVKNEPTPIVRAVEMRNEVTAKSLIYYDLSNNSTIFYKDPDNVLPIASISKIITCFLALKNLSPDSLVTVSEEAVTTMGESGDLKPGEVFYVKDLVKASMIFSSNDAAMVLAEAVGTKISTAGTYENHIDAFTNLMNETARELGMNSTSFKNPTGLDLGQGEPSNYSTANDLIKIINKSRREAPLLWDESRKNDAIIYSRNGVAHKLYNTDILVGSIPHIFGSKTGSTETASENIVILFEYPLGSPKALVLLGSSNGERYNDVQNIFINIGSPVLP